MSRHHRAQQWTTHAPKLRAALEAQLPLPCMDGCGAVITRETPRDAWQVGHRQDAARGGRPTVTNTGAILRTCNNRAGGKLGAAVTNSRRAQRDQGIREW